MVSRITPRLVWSALTAAMLAALVERGGSALGYWPRGLNPNVPFSFLMVLSYGMSLALSLRIAGDHKGSPAMRFAWLLFAGSSVLSMVRHSIQGVAAGRWFPEFQGATSYVAIQLPMALALVFLFTGLLSMWSAYSALGLGFHPERGDLALVSLMLLMLPPILMRNPARLPPDSPGWAVVLPIAGAVFLPACGAIAVLLHRVAMQMKGGDTARALRYLIWYPGVRLVAMLANVDPTLRTIPALTVPAYALFQIAPLVFTLALAYRWQITVKARAANAAECGVVQLTEPSAASPVHSS